MSIDFNCPSCGASLHAPPEYAGGTARCKGCGARLRVPKPPPKTPPGDTILVACPNCKERVSVELAGMAPSGRLIVACDYCGIEKKLSAFQRELARQVRQPEQTRRREMRRQKLRELAKSVASVAGKGVDNVAAALTPAEPEQSVAPPPPPPPPPPQKQPTPSSNGWPARRQQNPLALLAAVAAVFLFVIGIVCIIHSSSSSRSYTPSRSTYSPHKSTKPIWEMDGQEMKEMNDAWATMSREEKEKQIRRDFGPFPDD